MKRRFSPSRTLTNSGLALAIALPAGISSLGAATLINGSFENFGTYVNTPGTDRMSGVAANGWFVSTNTPDWFLGAPGPAGLWLTHWGDFFAVGAAQASTYREGLSQTVGSLSVGQTYIVKFQQANGLLFDQGSHLGTGEVGGWEVLVDGVSVGMSASANDNTTPSPAFTSAWTEGSITFEASATSQTIEFLAYGGSAGNPTFQFLDEVTIEIVPEPTSPLLASLGGLFVLRRRRD